MSLSKFEERVLFTYNCGVCLEYHNLDIIMDSICEVCDGIVCEQCSDLMIKYDCPYCRTPYREIISDEDNNDEEQYDEEQYDPYQEIRNDYEEMVQMEVQDGENMSYGSEYDE